MMLTTTVRRQPSLDLRKATRLAELASKQEIEPFSLENDMGSLYRSKLRGHQLRLSTSSPLLFNIYTSDEEQPSPQADEDTSSLSDYASCDDSLDDDDFEFDGDDEEADYEDNNNTTTFFETTMAIIVPMQMLKPSLVDLSVFAPMATRSIPISRPESASYATFIRVKAPSPTELRSPVHEKSIPNFSTPMNRKSSLSPPSSLHSGSSPASSVLSFSHSGESIEEEAEAMIRESDEIQMRQAVLSGTEWEDNMLESPTPTTWADYDPFALSIPTLTKAQTYHDDGVSQKAKGWRRLGLKSARFLAGSKRAAWN